MQVADSHAHLDRVEASTVFGESLCVAEVHKQLTTSHESHYEEDLLRRLEHVAHTDKEGVVSLQQNIFLEFGRFHLVVL